MLCMCEHFCCYCSQHDAHEFLIYLLEGLHEDVNRVRVKKKRILDSGSEVEYIRYEVNFTNLLLSVAYISLFRG